MHKKFQLLHKSFGRKQSQMKTYRQKSSDNKQATEKCRRGFIWLGLYIDKNYIDNKVKNKKKNQTKSSQLF